MIKENAGVVAKKAYKMNVKVLLDFFQKIVGSRGKAPGAPRRVRNTFASQSAGWDEKTDRWTVFEGKPTRLEGFPLLMICTNAMAVSFYSAELLFYRFFCANDGLLVFLQIDAQTVVCAFSA